MIKLFQILSEIKISGKIDQKMVRDLYWKKYKLGKTNEVVDLIIKYEQYVKDGHKWGSDVLISMLPPDKLNDLYRELSLIK